MLLFVTDVPECVTDAPDQGVEGFQRFHTFIYMTRRIALIRPLVLALDRFIKGFKALVKAGVTK
jgi:hypothetical protein